MSDEGIMAGPSGSDLARRGIEPGETDYGEAIVDEGIPSGLSMTDAAHKRGESGPLDPRPNDAKPAEPVVDPARKFNTEDVVAQEFMQSMNEAGMDSEAINQAVKWHVESSKADQAELHSMDAEARQEGLEELRSVWGADTRANIDLVKDLLKSGPGGLFESFTSARLPDGTALGNDPETMKFLFGLLQQSRQASFERSPDRSNVRIAEIEQYMRENRRAYNKDERMQSELRELYARRG